MTARDYIESLDRADFRIEKSRNRIERLENLAKNLSSKPYDNDRVQSSGSKDRIGDLTVKIVQEKEKLARLIEENDAAWDAVMDQIDAMENLNSSKIVYYRHIEKKNYNEISDMLDLSPKTVRDYHSKAMKDFEKITIK